jgi:hypothetical protein
MKTGRARLYMRSEPLVLHYFKSLKCREPCSVTFLTTTAIYRLYETMSLIALMRPPMIGVMEPLGSGQFGVSDWPQF